MTNNDSKFTWSENKLNVAKALSEGIKTQREIANQFNIAEVTVSRWKREPEFMEKVDEYTLAHDKATKAGLLREAYKGMDIKEKLIKDDRSTHLDYVKYVSKVQGHEVERVEHSGGLEVNVTEARERITSRINSIASRVREDTDSE
jgi:hypothetical protein